MRRREGEHREKKMEAKRETVGIYAWKARAARKNLQPRARVKDRQKRKTEKNVPPNQCSRPTELIPAKGFFVASIFSTLDFAGMLASARENRFPVSKRD